MPRAICGGWPAPPRNCAYKLIYITFFCPINRYPKGINVSRAKVSPTPRLPGGGKGFPKPLRPLYQNGRDLGFAKAAPMCAATTALPLPVWPMCPALLQRHLRAPRACSRASALSLRVGGRRYPRAGHPRPRLPAERVGAQVGRHAVITHVVHLRLAVAQSRVRSFHKAASAASLGHVFGLCRVVPTTKGVTKDARSHCTVNKPRRPPHPPTSEAARTFRGRLAPCSASEVCEHIHRPEVASLRARHSKRSPQALPYSVAGAFGPSSDFVVLQCVCRLGRARSLPSSSWPPRLP